MAFQFVIVLVLLLMAFSARTRARARLGGKLSPLRRRSPGAYVPVFMRLFLRRACLTLAAVSLIFYCSCERHHVDEMPLESHNQAPADEHAATTHASPS